MTPELYLYWQDNNGKRSDQRFYLPEGEAVAQSVGRANAIRDALRPLSNAQLVGGELVYPDIIEPLGVAAVGSNALRHLVCLFRSGEIVGSLRIPSPTTLPFDSSGPWAGQRVTRDALAALNLVAPLDAAVALTVFPWLDPFPATLVVASIDVTP